MKAKTFRLVSGFSLMMFAAMAHPGAGAITEELAVVQAITRILASESTRPYDYLYYESDFDTRKHVASSMADPDRTQFCGLSRDEGQALVKQITFLNMEPVTFDKSVAKEAGLGIGHKRFPKFRYLMLSRVVFDDAQEHAWLAADLNGESGALYRLDRVGGEWNRTFRCGGWVKAPD